MPSSAVLQFFLSEGFPEEEALPRANLYAALSTTTVGTQKSFYTVRILRRSGGIAADARERALSKC